MRAQKQEQCSCTLNGGHAAWPPADSLEDMSGAPAHPPARPPAARAATQVSKRMSALMAADPLSFVPEEVRNAAAAAAAAASPSPTPPPPPPAGWQAPPSPPPPAAPPAPQQPSEAVDQQELHQQIKGK